MLLIKVVENNEITHLASQIFDGEICYVRCDIGLGGTHPNFALFKDLHLRVGRDVIEHLNQPGKYHVNRFYLNRKKDPTGISGVGQVAEGVQFESFKLIYLKWKTRYMGRCWFRNLEQIQEMHGHEGMTEISFF